MASAQQGATMGIVGVSRVQEPMGFHIAGMQYNSDATNTPESVYGDSLPFNSKIYKFEGGAGYQIATYGQVFVPGVGLVTKWSSDLNLASGEGYWVEAPGAVDTHMYGDVPVADAITNSIVTGFQICSYPYPVDRAIADLGFTPTAGDQIFVWNSAETGYEIISYGSVFVPGTGLVTKWNNESVQIKVGQGFWYSSVVDTDWVVNRPFDTN